jgi:hypothetical protein
MKSSECARPSLSIIIRNGRPDQYLAGNLTGAVTSAAVDCRDTNAPTALQNIACLIVETDLYFHDRAKLTMGCNPAEKVAVRVRAGPDFLNPERFQ